MQNPISLTKKWIAEFVIFHSLCPFAKIPFEKDNILYKEIENPDIQMVLSCLHETVVTLDPYSNAFLILPPSSFDEYLDIFYKAELYLEETELNTDFQLASFHPEYQFEGYDIADKRNWTNRSPFPMLHILRVKEMEDAIESFGDTSKVFIENEKKMRLL